MGRSVLREGNGTEAAFSVFMLVLFGMPELFQRYTQHFNESKALLVFLRFYSHQYLIFLRLLKESFSSFKTPLIVPCVLRKL